MKRVVQISFDILIDKNTDGFDFAEEVANFLEANGFRVVGAGFQEDMTELYEEMYPNLIK